jgi:transcription elongation factor Elf1
MITQNHGNNADTVKSNICRYEYNSYEYIIRRTNRNINMYSKYVDEWIDRLLHVHLYT